MTASLDRAGSAAAILAAVCYVTGFVLFFSVIDADGYSGIAGQLAFALDNQAAINFAMIVLYLVFGVALLVLNGALRQKLEPENPGWSDIASATGVCWAVLVFAAGMIGLTGLSYVVGLEPDDQIHASTIWASLGAVQNGLGGGIEFVGGVWIIMISALSLQARLLPRALNWLGLGVGMVGIATALPIARDLVAVFGLSQIIWFAWIGFALMTAKGGSRAAPGAVQSA